MRHDTDVLFDFACLGEDRISVNMRRAFAGGEQATEHRNDGGPACAIGAEQRNISPRATSKEMPFTASTSS